MIVSLTWLICARARSFQSTYPSFAPPVPSQDTYTNVHCRNRLKNIKLTCSNDTPGWGTPPSVAICTTKCQTSGQVAWIKDRVMLRGGLWTEPFKSYTFSIIHRLPGESLIHVDASKYFYSLHQNKTMFSCQGGVSFQGRLLDRNWTLIFLMIDVLP